MIDGEIGRDAMLPDESDVSAVTTNCWRRPTEEYDSGLTAFTPAIVRMSPRFRFVAPDAQPEVFSVEPVWPAPLMIGVEAVNVPDTNVGRIGSWNHLSIPN